MQGLEMKRKSARPAAKKAEIVVSVSGASRKLLTKRLRELDKLTAKEVAVIMADAEKIRQAFRLKR
jgi:hypothetical protein